MSMNIAISGLNAANAQLTGISQNIANTGTTGYRSSRVEFGAMYNNGAGNGVRVLATTQSFSGTGPTITTGRSLDTMITGEGFFVTKGTDGQTYYTRNGAFVQDAEGYLIDSNGNRVQGYPVDAEGNLATGAVSDLQIPTGTMPAESTTNVDVVLNLDNRETPIVRGDGTAPAGSVPFDPTSTDSYHFSNTTMVYDSMGTEHPMTQYYTKTSDNPITWETRVYVDGVPVDGSTPDQPAANQLEFDENGELVNYAPVAISIDGTVLGEDGEPILGSAAAMAIEIDMTGTTQFASPNVVNTNYSNGYAAGDQTGVSIDEKGQVVASYSNGKTQVQGQVVLANFASPVGLTSTNGTTWVETAASGQPLYGTPGTGNFAVLQVGSLEGSNVDLSAELVGLMEAQRNYQANSKVISTSNQMTQVLMQSIG